MVDELKSVPAQYCECVLVMWQDGLSDVTRLAFSSAESICHMAISQREKWPGLDPESGLPHGNLVWKG